MKRVRVAADRWNFELDGTKEFITPIGGNMLNDEHPGQGTLFSHFDAADCDRRFGIMSELGLNCLRQTIDVNRVFDPATGLKAQGLKNWETFISLAEKHGIWLMPVGGYVGGNDWFDVELLADNGKALDDSCAFFDSFCRHFAGHPAVWAWDLRNELLFWPRPHRAEPGSAAEKRVEAKLKDEWPRWLEIRYGTVAAMNRAYGTSHTSFAEAPGSVVFVEKPFDPCTYDFRNYLNDRGHAWCKRHCDTIRAASPGHMIVSGNNTWLSPDQDLFLANGFHNRTIHDLFDFITFHPYPACQAVPNGRGDPLENEASMEYWVHSCIGNARMDHYGKPVVVQEFGWYGGGPSHFLCDLPNRTEEEHARYISRFCAALVPHVNGFLNWPTMDMTAADDISNHGGIFTADGRRKKLADVYEKELVPLSGIKQVRKPSDTTLAFSLPGLYTSRKVQDRMWDDVHEVMKAGKTPDFRFIA